jgi:hypothetical protein
MYYVKKQHSGLEQGRHRNNCRCSGYVPLLCVFVREKNFRDYWMHARNLKFGLIEW